MAGGQCWLITGASSGLGLALAMAALKAGNKVLATARNVEKARAEHPGIDSLGGTWIKLDTSTTDAGADVAKAIESAGGKIDVVINNAGYSLLGSVEDMSEDEITSQMNTNFYGPIRIIKAVLPKMRAQKSGTIVNISSIAALDPLPSCALYSASKAAFEAFSESLALEVGPWNIRVLIVEPGVFRTNFFNSFTTPERGLNSAYEGTIIDNTLKAMRGFHGNKGGDPIKAAQRIIEVVAGTGLDPSQRELIRLPLGKDSYTRAANKMDSVKANLEAFKVIAHNTEWT